MVIPHPIPYQGSKRAIAHAILEYFPEEVERLIEPFAGSAAVSLAAAHAGRAKRFWLNDINAPLISLWEAIINRPEDIASGYEHLWQGQLGQEREYYDFIRGKFNETHRPDYFLYLLARCVKASVRYNVNGEFNQSPDNRRKGARPDGMRRHIIGASRLLRDRTTLMAVDYQAVLDVARPLDLVYMDPPYQGVCVNGDPRYIRGLDFDEFVESLQVLNGRGIAFIVSYDGRTEQKSFGKLLPSSLGLGHIEIDAGRSSQATLLGRTARTYESLYLSPALTARLNEGPTENPVARQLSLF